MQHFWIWAKQLRLTYLYVSFLTKGTVVLSLLYVCLIYRAISHHQYFMVQYFHSSEEYLDALKTDIFCAQDILRHLCSASECKIKPVGLAVPLNFTGIITFFTVNFIYLFIFFPFYSNKLLVVYSLIKCQNFVGKTRDN